MTICYKCEKETTKSYQCDHTNDQEFCLECYTELHYYLTEPKTA